MIDRIYSSQKDKQDVLFLDEYFKLIDADGDGFINYDDLVSMTGELGALCMSEQVYHLMVDKICHDGTKISKAEFI